MKDQEIVIVGAGIAGLATSLGLHRLGIPSIVVESADSLRSSGFALGIWTNGWRALDAIGIGDLLRSKHHKLTGIVTTSVDLGSNTSERAIHKQDDLELRFVNRIVMLETLENELPKGTIRYCSKVVHIESEDRVKSVHLADGTVLKTKVLIGCDGVNSMVSRFLGQGGCSALEESVVLARLLAEALKGNGEENEHQRIERALERFARERRWRSFDLIATAYVVGLMQQSEGGVMRFLRDKLLAKFLGGLLLKKASFDCGELADS